MWLTFHRVCDLESQIFPHTFHEYAWIVKASVYSTVRYHNGIVKSGKQSELRKLNLHVII